MTLKLNNAWFEKLLPQVLVREVGVLCASCTDAILMTVPAGAITWLGHERCADEWQRIRIEFSNAIINQHPESLHE